MSKARRGRGRSRAGAAKRDRDRSIGTGLLELTAWNADDTARAGLWAFRSMLLVHAAVRTWAWVSLRPPGRPALEWAVVLAFLLAMIVAASLSFTSRFARRAPMLAGVLLAIEVGSSFPGTPNHVFLELVCVLLFALLDPDRDDERPLLLAGLRWVVLIVLFYTGLQKLLLGYYLRGEFLVWAMAVGDRFAEVFSWMLPAEEVARIAALDGVTKGSGPYRTTFVPFRLVSNGVWIAEMLLPALMLASRTRVAASVAALTMVLTIQLGAREVMFALLVVQLLLVVPSADWNRRATPLLGLAYAYIALYLLGIAPGEFLVRGRGGL